MFTLLLPLISLVLVVVGIWALVKLSRSRWARWIVFGILAIFLSPFALTAVTSMAASHQNFGVLYHRCTALFGTSQELSSPGRLACSFADVVIPTDPRMVLFWMISLGLLVAWIAWSRFIRPRQSKFRGGGVVAELHADKGYVSVIEPGAKEPLIFDFGTIVVRACDDEYTTTRTVHYPGMVTDVTGSGMVFSATRGGSYDESISHKTGKTSFHLDSITKESYLDKMCRSDGNFEVNRGSYNSQHHWVMPNGQAKALLRWFSHHRALLAFDERKSKLEWTRLVAESLSKMRQRFNLTPKELLESYRMSGACAFDEYIAIDGKGMVHVFRNGESWTFAPQSVDASAYAGCLRCTFPDGNWMDTGHVTKDMLRRLERVKRSSR